MTLDEMQVAIEEARLDMERAREAYSVCTLTGARCAVEQRAYESAERRWKELRKKYNKQQKHGHYNDN